MRKHLKMMGLGLIILACLIYIGQGFFVAFLWGETDQAFHQGDYKRAEQYLTLITWLRPKDEQAYLLKGWLQWSQAYTLKKRNQPFAEDLKTASATLKQGQVRNPSSWRLYYEEGIMWEAFKENEKSLKAYYQMCLRCGAPYNRMYYWKKARLQVVSP